MVYIYFTKKYTSGILKGLSSLQKLSYPTAQQCAKVIYRGKKGRDCITGDRWIITDCAFQNYARN